MAIDIRDYLSEIDPAALAAEYRSSQPTHFFCVDGFLQPDFAREVIAAYPAYEEAAQAGHRFTKIEEKGKIQITDPSRFPEPVRILNELLAAPAFLGLMQEATGIADLQADAELSGGGMHVMAGGGRLDVHVDFNLIEARGLWRRLNILIFLNERWESRWGGLFELWDPDVRRCLHRLEPIANRCVVFNTTETSYHGVTPLKVPPGVTRNSFAAYYYTASPPEGASDRFHSTLFRTRPRERWRAAVVVPAAHWLRRLRGKLRARRSS